MALDGIHALIDTAPTAFPKFPPTLVFNEGWMLRLLLGWFSSHEVSGHPLNFQPGASWFSEALLPSPFRPRYRGDRRSEARTHADGVIGHISVGALAKSDTSLQPEGTQFVVTEAKMFSPLSAGTKNAPGYGQAARNVGCIAEVVFQAAIPPSKMKSLGFLVLAPESQIREGAILNQLDKGSIRDAVVARSAPYGTELDVWLSEWFSPTLNSIEIAAFSWENAIEDVNSLDPETGASLASFYSLCVEHNRPKADEVPA